MAYLVHSFTLIPVELSLLVHCVLFEEEADLVPRRQEVVISDVVIVPGSELGLSEVLAFYLTKKGLLNVLKDGRRR